MSVSVIIPYGLDDPWRTTLFDWVSRRWEALCPGFQLVVADSYVRPFSRSQARNVAAKEATGDIFIIADADTVAPFSQILAAVQKVEEGAGWGFAYETYYNLSMESTEGILCRDPVCALPHDFTFEHEIVDSPAGLLVLTRGQFEALGGYDERFVGWGYEDNAFRIAMKRLHGPPFRVEGIAYHLWHPIVTGTTFDSPTIHANRTLFRQYERASTVAQMQSLLVR